MTHINIHFPLSISFIMYHLNFRTQPENWEHMEFLAVYKLMIHTGHCQDKSLDRFYDCCMRTLLAAASFTVAIWSPVGSFPFCATPHYPSTAGIIICIWTQSPSWSPLPKEAPIPNPCAVVCWLVKTWNIWIADLQILKSTEKTWKNRGSPHRHNVLQQTHGNSWWSSRWKGWLCGILNTCK